MLLNAATQNWKEKHGKAIYKDKCRECEGTYTGITKRYLHNRCSHKKTLLRTLNLKSSHLKLVPYLQYIMS